MGRLIEFKRSVYNKQRSDDEKSIPTTAKKELFIDGEKNHHLVVPATNLIVQLFVSYIYGLEAWPKTVWGEWMNQLFDLWDSHKGTRWLQ